MIEVNRDGEYIQLYVNRNFHVPSLDKSDAEVLAEVNRLADEIGHKLERIGKRPEPPKRAMRRRIDKSPETDSGVGRSRSRRSVEI